MMKFKPLSQLNWFFKLAPEKTLCGIDQLVYLHIFNKFNQSHWAETILVSDAELLEQIRWYDKTGSPTSMNLIKTAKARLKKKGLIEYKAGTGNNTTQYQLIRLYPPDTPDDTPADTPPRPSGEFLFTHARRRSRLQEKKSTCQWRGRV